MESKPLEERVTLLENDLRGLRESVGALDTQVTAVVVQSAEFRDEVRGEFSSMRAEMTSMRDELRKDMTSMREELRKEIREGDDETRRLMRVLHEDLVARIALIDRG
jgi:hypothetical protein